MSNPEQAVRAPWGRVLPDRGFVGVVVARARMLGGFGECGGSGDGSSALDVAEARVSAAERDLADARTDFTEKSAEFCVASATYLTALDRYGDVLTQTAVTVGDVRDAGTDLEQPREDVM